MALSPPFWKVCDSEPWTQIRNLPDRFYRKLFGTFAPHSLEMMFRWYHTKSRRINRNWWTQFEISASQKHYFRQKCDLGWIWSPPVHRKWENPIFRPRESDFYAFRSYSARSNRRSMFLMIETHHLKERGQNRWYSSKPKHDFSRITLVQKASWNGLAQGVDKVFYRKIHNFQISFL